MSEDLDLFVIGAGSGGVRAARFSASLGARVAIAEESHFGGTCVNVGCVPKKLMMYAASFRDQFRLAGSFGWQGDGYRHSWPEMATARNQEIQRLEGLYGKMLAQSGVAVHACRARIAGPNRIRLEDGKELRAREILIATGSTAFRPKLPGAEHGVLSDDLFELKTLPGRVVVIGGGYIAVEFASILHGLGAQTTLLYRGTRLLRKFDSDLGPRLADAMRRAGVDVRLGVQPERITCPDPSKEKTLHLAEGPPLQADLILFATGRRPNSADLGLETVDIEPKPGGAIPVDDNYQTPRPGIHAIGDVTDRLNLTPVAIHEGMHVACRLFGQPRPALDYRLVPSAVFSQPPVGSCGLSEEEARAQYDTIEVYTAEFRPMDHAFLPHDETRIFMKLVVRLPDEVVVGVHMIGDHAAEILQGFAVALQAGVTKPVFDRTVGIHPSSAEELVTMREPRAAPARP